MCSSLSVLHIEIFTIVGIVPSLISISVVYVYPYPEPPLWNFSVVWFCSSETQIIFLCWQRRWGSVTCAKSVRIFQAPRIIAYSLSALTEILGYKSGPLSFSFDWNLTFRRVKATFSLPNSLSDPRTSGSSNWSHMQSKFVIFCKYHRASDFSEPPTLHYQKSFLYTCSNMAFPFDPYLIFVIFFTQA